MGGGVGVGRGWGGFPEFVPGVPLQLGASQHDGWHVKQPVPSRADSRVLGSAAVLQPHSWAPDVMFTLALLCQHPAFVM